MRLFTAQIWLTGVLLALDMTVAGGALAITVEDAAVSDEWRTLLYYRPGSEISEHSDPRFFLSPEGYASPLAELKAHIDADRLSREPGNDHPRCRFPARYHWLVGQALVNQTPAVIPRCEAFDNFRRTLDARSVSVIYPVPHMGSVSTLFGHSFLRLNRGEPDHSQDFTLNFAAYVRESDDQVDVVRKGLSNGFDGIFTVIRYQKKLGEYKNMDSRDILEYPLDLTAEETAQLVRHVWEVKPIHSEYRFFSSNCSNQMLHFIDVARPGLSLHERLSVYVIPGDAVNVVHDAGIVRSVSLTPSPRTQRRMARTGETLAPHASRDHDSGRISLASGQQEGVTTMDLGIRAAYHDRYDPPTAGPLGADIDVFALRVRHYVQGSTDLQQLALFDAHSFDPRDSESSAWSWQFGTGFLGRRLRNDAIPEAIGDAADNERYLMMLESMKKVSPFYVRSGVGPSWGSDSLLGYALVGGEWQLHPDLHKGQEAFATLSSGLRTRGEQWQGSIDTVFKQPAWTTSLPAEGEVSATLSHALDEGMSVFATVDRRRDVLEYQSGWRVGLGVYY